MYCVNMHNLCMYNSPVRSKNGKDRHILAEWSANPGDQDGRERCRTQSTAVIF